MEDTDTESRIPNLIKIGEIPSSYGQVLTTDIIDPVTFNQTRCRFTLQRVAGFLHSNSKITVGITPLTTANAYYPMNIGVGNVIQSARLSIGQQTVCSTEDFASFHAYQSVFLTNENNKEREQFMSQRCMNHGMRYDDRAVDGVVNTPNAAKAYSIELGRNPTVVTATGVGATELLPFQQHDGTDAQGIADAPVYSIYLSDLFPFLQTNQLPCFMLDEEVHIDITWTDQTNVLKAAGVQSTRMCVGNGADATVAYQINQDAVKLVYDSISYDGDVMAQYAAQNPELSFQYVDYSLAKRTGDLDDFSGLTFPVGGNGRLVSKVILGLQSNSNYQAESMLNGQGIASAPVVTTEVSVNLRYNDRFEFSSDRSNAALLFHTTQQAEGGVPMVTRQEYSREAAATITSDTFMGHNQQSSEDGIMGNFNWIAIRPNRGERINNQGVDLIYKNTLPAGGAEIFTLRVYLELLMTATISNGKFQTSFA